MERIIALGIGYLCGGIQSAVLYSRLKNGVDIREHGSGNAGTTNTMRVLGKKAGIIVFLADFFKAILAIIIAKALFGGNPYIIGLYAGIGAILGHSYPLFFKFKGGKGIAVTVGVMYFIDLKIGLIASAVFFITLYFIKIVSLSSMLLTMTIPVCILIFYKDASFFNEAMALAVFIVAFTTYRHKENIKRLIAGTEARVKSKKKENS
ncbi:MAG: glycerol-3-phosphate 1-O-acyltransferase PlsY [Cellulosilyticaceae bacterium]